MGVSWSGQELSVPKALQRWGDFLPSPVQSILGWVLGYNIQRTKEPLSSRSGHFELQEVVLLNMESCGERKEKKRTRQEQSLFLFRILRIAELLRNSSQGSVLISEA
jgi:hypothetical protein